MPSPAGEPYLLFDEITKTFPGVRALQGVRFGCREGSVHALMGENGAGKSTLLKVLSGVYRPDGGQLRLGGQAVSFANTADALAAGVAVIYQELHLVPELSVAENIYLGHLPAAGGWVSRGQLRQDAARWLAQLGEDIDPRAKLGSLSLGQRQMVEIAKAMARDAKVIAFDEPTSSLSSRETERLFAVIDQLKQQGRVVLYVSHRMDEIYATCDAATVLRDGQHVATFDELASVPREELVRRMVGRSIADIWGYTPRQHGKVALDVRGVTGPGLTAPASFNVHAGEIVGFFGLIGAGRSELMKLVYGATRATGGTVSLFGRPLAIRSPTDALAEGIALATEDRKKEGIIPQASVNENLNLTVRRKFARLRTFIDFGRERQHAQDYVQRLAVKTPSLKQPIRLLSGGNQQKVLLARWLSESPKVLLVDEPTRGIDVGAKSEIYGILYKLAEQGVAVVVVSSELPEVMGVCDRVLVMRQGQIVADVNRGEATQDRLLEWALPIESQHAAAGTWSEAEQGRTTV
jgi:L-arabinose transport system ATP-binding protein